MYPAPVEPSGGWPRTGGNSSSSSDEKVQTELKRCGFYNGAIDGDFGPKSIQGVWMYQQTRWLVQDGDWGYTTNQYAFPPEHAIFCVDYSFTNEWTGEELAGRGVNGAGRYVYGATYDGGKPGKGMDKPEFDDLTAHGVPPWYSYETDHTDPISGFATGVRHAQDAAKWRALYDLPKQITYYNWDTDYFPERDRENLLNGLRGAISIDGASWVGLYGEYDAIKDAFDAGLIVSGWQTYAWSGGPGGVIQWDPRAKYRQWKNGQWNDTVDFCWNMTNVKH